MSKNKYWIVNPNGGAKALVEGAEERDRWTRVHGWDEADEPVSGDMVHVTNADTGGQTTLPWDTLAEGAYWHGVGFAPSAPPEPVDVTKDPALRDQPAAKPAPAPRVGGHATTTTTAAAGADKIKE